MKRAFDFVVSFIFLIILSPFFIIISLLIVLDSRGNIFYTQERVGLNFRMFRIFKFRTMKPNSDTRQLITVGVRDNRITRVGYYLRKYKLDELPQLLNVFIGDMSLVGPRPEVQRYVDLYTPEQRKVLSVKPGITDLASIQYANENEILSKYSDPDKGYVEEIMPAKLRLNLEYLQKRGFLFDLSLIMKTIGKILS